MLLKAEHNYYLKRKNMAYTITISTSEQVCNNEGDTLQLILIFDVDLTDSDQAYTAAEKNIKVTDWGAIEWAYDFEDALMVPSNYQVKLYDGSDYLKNLLWGTSEEALATNKQVSVTLKINGTVEYEGIAQEDGLRWEGSNKNITLNIDANTLLFNQKRLYNDSGAAYDHLNYNDPHSLVKYTKLLEDIYGIVNPDISYSGGDIIINQNWTFNGKKHTSNLPAGTDVITESESHDVTGANWNNNQSFVFTDLYQETLAWFFDSSYGLTTMGDVLKKLAIDWCCFTGMINKNKAFFQQLFYYNASNLQTVDVKGHSIFNKFNKIDYVEIASVRGQVYKEPSASADSAIDERRIKRKIIPGLYSVNLYGVDPHWTLSNCQAVIPSGSNAGTYVISSCNSTTPSHGGSNGLVNAKYWYHWRGNITNCRVDEFLFKGITYDFLKNFNYNNGKYQIIRMKKQLAKNLTNTEALYLGEL